MKIRKNVFFSKTYLNTELCMQIILSWMMIEKAIQNLSGYLGKLTAYFLDKEYNAPDI